MAHSKVRFFESCEVIRAIFVLIYSTISFLIVFYCTVASRQNTAHTKSRDKTILWKLQGNWAWTLYWFTGRRSSQQKKKQEYLHIAILYIKKILKIFKTQLHRELRHLVLGMSTKNARSRNVRRVQLKLNAAHVEHGTKLRPHQLAKAFCKISWHSFWCTWPTPTAGTPKFVRPAYLSCLPRRFWKRGWMKNHAPMFLCSSWHQTNSLAWVYLESSSASSLAGKGHRASSRMMAVSWSLPSSVRCLASA